MSKKELILLLIIIVLAGFFRLWQLEEVPPGLYPDVAINGNEALDSLKTGNFRIFYPENNGREGLMIWLIALSFSIFGVSIWSIKIVAAIIGILTVFGLYLLAKELFSSIYNQQSQISNKIALLASFFLAISFWHTNFSRIGFRAILLPFVLVFAFYSLFKGFNTKKILNFIISGIFFGLGFYTYSSFRMAILILPFIFIPYYLLYKKENLQKKFLIHTSLFLIFTFIVALPIGIYFLKNPHDFVGRLGPISIFSAENPLKEFAKSLILHLGMFNFYGDPNWRHNFAGSPQLFWPIGILFLIGFLISLKEIINFLKHKNWSLVISHWSLVVWFLAMLLPGILTREGIPHALRTIGVLPAVYIFVALASWKIYQWLNENAKNKKLLYFAVFFFLLTMAVAEFDKYFNKWGKNLQVKNAFSENYLQIGNFLNSLPANIQKYVIVNMPGVPVPWPNGLPMPAQTVMFIENTKYGSPQSVYLMPESLDKIKIEREAVIVPLKDNKNLFDKLSEKFPNGEIESQNNILFYKIF